MTTKEQLSNYQNISEKLIEESETFISELESQQKEINKSPESSTNLSSQIDQYLGKKSFLENEISSLREQRGQAVKHRELVHSISSLKEKIKSQNQRLSNILLILEKIFREQL
jgi:chromosome segregation ATPase